MKAADFPVDDIPMFLVVDQLAYRGALRPTDLAFVLGTGRAKITKIVRRLEGADLVYRVPSPTDERSVLVTLTQQGREVGKRIMDNTEHQFATALASWSEDEIAVFKRLLFRFSREAVHDLALHSPGITKQA